MDIKELGGNTRINNVFEKFKIKTVEELCTGGQGDILRLPGIGKKSFLRILELLASKGYSLAEESNWDYRRYKNI